MARETLIGDYGSFQTISLGTDLIVAEVLTLGEWYLPTVIDPSTGFDANAEVGYLFQSDGTETLVGSDVCKLLTMTTLCDIQNWKLDFTKDDIEVTTLCDSQKKYLPAKSDVAGSSTGVFKIGITDAVNGIQNAFVDIVQASGTYAINKLNDSSIYVKLITQEATDSGETEQFYFAPISFSTFGQGATSGEAQTFEASFKVAPDETNGVKLAYYSNTHA